MHPEALAAARELGLALDLHGAEPLTAELCERASIIYCMTAEQRDAVVAISPDSAAKTFLLDPDGPLPEPKLGSGETWGPAVSRLRDLVGSRLSELPAPGAA
jgi:protein-tyrosine-phosphatase